MTMHSFALTTGRLNKYKGQILKHAVPLEVLSKTGRQVQFPKNNSDTYVARRWLPYKATSTSASTMNQFFQTGTGDRVTALTQENLISEGVTPTPESLTPVDVTVVMQQYGCLYGFTDKTYNLYEDDIPQAMIEQVGERISLVNEMVIYGALKACTNVYYGGTGTSVATVNGGLTLGFVRKISKNLQANHGAPVNTALKASPNYGTDAVAPGYNVYGHTDLEPDIRDLAGFIPAEKYATGAAQPNEIGKVERFRFILSPDLPSQQDGGAAVGATGLYTTSASNIDVYTIVVTAKDAYSQVSVRGLDSLSPTYLPPGQKTKSDPLGQRGYAGSIWWKACMIENSGWMAIGHVGVKTLS